MCVRSCDGFYFPVSFATTKRNFKKDAQACKSRCGMPASLYVFPNPGGDIKDMVSYKKGEAYDKLKNAFLYRKKFVASCRCAPEPWMQSERERHARYAKANIDPMKVLAKADSRTKRKSRRARRRIKSRSRAQRHRSASARKLKYYVRSAKRKSRRRVR
jgi:NAD+--asparagine ADP-ribosyltransferase